MHNNNNLSNLNNDWQRWETMQNAQLPLCKNRELYAVNTNFGCSIEIGARYTVQVEMYLFYMLGQVNGSTTHQLDR